MVGSSYEWTSDSRDNNRPIKPFCLWVILIHAVTVTSQYQYQINISSRFSLWSLIIWRKPWEIVPSIVMFKSTLWCVTCCDNIEFCGTFFCYWYIILNFVVLLLLVYNIELQIRPPQVLQVLWILSSGLTTQYRWSQSILYNMEML